jgi:hypothetical protein
MLHFSKIPNLNLVATQSLRALEDLSPYIKQMGHENNHSPPSTAQLRMSAAVPALLQMPAWHA